MALRILVADDQLHVLRLMRLQLERDHHEVLQAHDGSEALLLALQDPPDLLILDVLMPTRDGLTALRRLKREKSTRRIPVIVLASAGDEGLRREAEFSGADLVLTKPFSPTQLRTEIRRLLRAPAEADLAHPL